jgi:AraC-like DNA-binding protein
VAVAIGATRDAAVLAEGRGVRAARIAPSRPTSSRMLGRVDLSLTALAARHGVTPRYIRMLFETEDLTFSEFVLQQRLVRAHRLLTDPRCPTAPSARLRMRPALATCRIQSRLPPAFWLHARRSCAQTRAGTAEDR